MAIVRVQSVGTSGTADVTSFAGSCAATVAGNTLIAIVYWVANTGTGSVSAPAGWIHDVGDDSGNTSLTTDIFHLENIAAGITSVTFTNTATGSACVILIEVSGLATSSAIDQTATHFSATTTTARDSGTTAATTTASEFWVATYGHFSADTLSGITAGWTAGTTVLATGGTHRAAGQELYQIAAATGAADVQATASTARTYNGVIATFKAAGGGGVVNSGLVDMGGSGALTPQGTETSLIPSGVVDMGSVGGTGGTHRQSLGDQGGGLVPTGTTLIFSGVATLGDGGGGLRHQSLGDQGGGLVVSAAVSQLSGLCNMGTNDTGGIGRQWHSGTRHNGGLVDSGSTIITPGLCLMGTQETGLAPFWFFPGTPGGHWVAIARWRWRVANPPTFPYTGWYPVTVKRWHNGAWVTLSS